MYVKCICMYVCMYVYTHIHVPADLSIVSQYFFQWPQKLSLSRQAFSHSMVRAYICMYVWLYIYMYMYMQTYIHMIEAVSPFGSRDRTYICDIVGTELTSVT